MSVTRSAGRIRVGAVLMVDLRELHVQYVVDDHGNKSGVLLSLDAFDALMEELEDLVVLAERRDEETLPHEQVVDELKRDGLL